MMLTVRCACKRQHTDRSEVTNGYGVLCGCESGIFENVPTSEGEECKVCSIKTRARLARDDSEWNSGDDNECDRGDSGEYESEWMCDDSDDSENGSATIVTIVATIVAIVSTIVTIVATIVAIVSTIVAIVVTIVSAIVRTE